MKLIGIGVRSQKREPLTIVGSAMLTTEQGICGDFRSAHTSADRQVTILSKEGWETACKEVGLELPWITRRANFLIEGLQPSADSVGACLHIGKNAILEITGETRPCDRMDEEHPGLKEALQTDWRAGITCRIIRDGDVFVGDDIVLCPRA